MTTRPIDVNDLEEVRVGVGEHWSSLRNAKLFVTGATGFFGTWLLESFLHANRALGLNATLTALSRDPSGFARRMPHLTGDPALRVVEGDVRSFTHREDITHIIHAATAASAALLEASPLEMFDTILAGTRRVLDLAVDRGGPRVLLTSSGAVYGRQPPALSHTPETYPGGPDPTTPRSAYAEGKRAAEQLAALYHSTFKLPTVITRGFAFVGPHLPLNTHFAIGNFIRDGLNGQPIHVAGDGTPYRSYQYGSELATWLWVLLLQGRSDGAYNVGSEQPVSIAELARLCGEVFSVPVTIAKTPVEGAAAERYVPSTARAQTELGLQHRVALRAAIERTGQWHRAS